MKLFSMKHFHPCFPAEIIIFFCYSCCNVINVTGTVIQAVMTFEEDQPANVFVGLITNSVQWRQKYLDDKAVAMKFTFLDSSKVTNYFKLDPTTGGLFSRVLIDRDALCVNSDLCCEEEMYRSNGGIMLCTLNFKVKALTENNEFTLVDVKIDLVDKNDNSPNWQSNRLTRHILESTEMNREIDLPLASDRDSGRNAVVLYRLKNGQDKNFSLRATRDEVNSGDAIVKLQLISLTSLDREQQASYTLVVIAEDGGGKSAELVVNIVVDDINDNAPQFLNGSFISIKISEDTPTHSQLLRLRAIDNDVGDNGKVTYQLGNDAANGVGHSNRLLLRHMFAVDPEVGSIMLVGQLNFEERRRYVVPILAYDNGIPRQSSQLVVTVDVLDINDEKPVIEVHPMTGRQISVLENQSTLTSLSIATISVKDKDSGSNGQVDCLLKEGTEDFALAPLSTQKSALAHRYYSLQAVKSFDRETRNVLTVSLLCSDNGVPSQATVSRFEVYITDLNDCVPIFKPTAHFQFRIKENLSPNSPIGQIRAIDDDSGENGEVWYRIEPNNNADVRVDSKTGELYTRVQFDRESRESYTFYVVATDRGQPRASSSTATINLIVLDVNDNPPVFTESTPTRVDISEGIGLTSSKQTQQESLYNYVPFATINATDKDSEDNGRISFRITQILSKSNLAISNKLFILRQNLLHVLPNRLDRERLDQYIVVIEARDHGHEARTATLSLTVDITDVNDNSPQFLWPTNKTYDLNITTDVTKGASIAQIQAKDSDLGSNGIIAYKLLTIPNSDDHSYFDIDIETGNLRVSKNLIDTKRKLFRLLIQASDLGVPSLSQNQRFHVRLLPPNSAGNDVFKMTSSEETDKFDSRHSNNSLLKNNGISNVVVFLVAGLAAVALLFLLLIIVYLVNRRHQHHHVFQHQIKHPDKNENMKSMYDTIGSKNGRDIRTEYTAEQNLNNIHEDNHFEFKQIELCENIELNESVGCGNFCKPVSCSSENATWRKGNSNQIPLISSGSVYRVKYAPEILAPNDCTDLSTAINEYSDIKFQKFYASELPTYTQMNSMSCEELGNKEKIDDYSEYCAKTTLITNSKPLISIATTNLIRQMKYPYDDISNV